MAQGHSHTAIRWAQTLNEADKRIQDLQAQIEAKELSFQVAQLKAEVASAAAEAQAAEQRAAQREGELARLRADLSHRTHASTQFVAELDAARRALHSDRPRPSASIHPPSSVAPPTFPHAPPGPDLPSASSLPPQSTQPPLHLSPRSLSDLRTHLRALRAEVEALQAENRQLRGRRGAAGARTSTHDPAAHGTAAHGPAGHGADAHGTAAHGTAAHGTWSDGAAHGRAKEASVEDGLTQLDGGGNHSAGSSAHRARHSPGPVRAPHGGLAGLTVSHDEVAILLQDPAGRSRLRAVLHAADAADAGAAAAGPPLGRTTPSRGQLGWDLAEAAPTLGCTSPARGYLGLGRAAWIPGAAAAAGVAGDGGSGISDLGAGVRPHVGAGSRGISDLGACGSAEEREPERTGRTEPERTRRGGLGQDGRGAGMDRARVNKDAGYDPARADKVQRREGHKKARPAAAPSSAPAPCRQHQASSKAAAAGAKMGAASSSAGKARMQAGARTARGTGGEPLPYSTGAGPHGSARSGAKPSAEATAGGAAGVPSSRSTGAGPHVSARSNAKPSAEAAAEATADALQQQVAGSRGFAEAVQHSQYKFDAKSSAEAAAEAAAAAALLEQLRADNAALNCQLQAAVLQLEAAGREQRTQLEAAGSAAYAAAGKEQRTQLEQLRADNAALNRQLQAAVSQLEGAGREQRTQLEAAGSPAYAAPGEEQRAQLEQLRADNDALNCQLQTAVSQFEAAGREQRTQLEVAGGTGQAALGREQWRAENSAAQAAVGREQHTQQEALVREQRTQQEVLGREQRTQPQGMERPYAAMQGEAGAQTEISAMNATSDQCHAPGQRATLAHQGEGSHHCGSECERGTLSSLPQPHHCPFPTPPQGEPMLEAQAASLSPSPKRQAGLGVLFRSTDSGAGSKQPTDPGSPDLRTKGVPSVRTVKSVLEDSHRPRSSSDVALLLESYSRARRELKDQEAVRADLARHEGKAHDKELLQDEHAGVEAELAAKVAELARHKADLEHASMLIEDARAAQAHLSAQLDAAMGELQSVRHVLVSSSKQPEQAPGAALGLREMDPAAASAVQPQPPLGQGDLGRPPDHSGAPSLASLVHSQSPRRPEEARPSPSTISSGPQPTQAAAGGSAQLVQTRGGGSRTSKSDSDSTIDLDQGDEEKVEEEEEEEEGSEVVLEAPLPSPILEQMMILPLFLFGGRILEQDLQEAVCEGPAPPLVSWPELQEVEVDSPDLDLAHGDGQIAHGEEQVAHGEKHVVHGVEKVAHGEEQKAHGEKQIAHGEEQVCLPAWHELQLCEGGEDDQEMLAHRGGNSRGPMLLSSVGLHRHSQQSQQDSDTTGGALDARLAAMQGSGGSTEGLLPVGRQPMQQESQQHLGGDSDARCAQLALMAEVEALEQRAGEVARRAREYEQGLTGRAGEKLRKATPVTSHLHVQSVPTSRHQQQQQDQQERQQQHQQEQHQHRHQHQHQQHQQSQMLTSADAGDEAGTGLCASAAEEEEDEGAVELGQSQLELCDQHRYLEQGTGQVHRHPQKHQLEDQQQHVVQQPRLQQRVQQREQTLQHLQQQAPDDEEQQQQQQQQQRQRQLQQQHTQQLQESPPPPLGQRLAEHLKRHSLLSQDHAPFTAGPSQAGCTQCMVLPAAMAARSRPACQGHPAVADAASTLTQPHSRGSRTEAASTHAQSQSSTLAQPHSHASCADAASTYSQPRSHTSAAASTHSQSQSSTLAQQSTHPRSQSATLAQPHTQGSYAGAASTHSQPRSHTSAAASTHSQSQSSTLAQPRTQGSCAGAVLPHSQPRSSHSHTSAASTDTRHSHTSAAPAHSRHSQTSAAPAHSHHSHTSAAPAHFLTRAASTHSHTSAASTYSPPQSRSSLTLPAGLPASFWGSSPTSAGSASALSMVEDRSSAGRSRNGLASRADEDGHVSDGSGSPSSASVVAHLPSIGAGNWSVMPGEETEEAHRDRDCSKGSPREAEEAVGEHHGAASVPWDTAADLEHTAASQQLQQQQQQQLLLWSGPEHMAASQQLLQQQQQQRRRQQQLLWTGHDEDGGGSDAVNGDSASQGMVGSCEGNTSSSRGGSRGAALLHRSCSMVPESQSQMSSALDLESRPSRPGSGTSHSSCSSSRGRLLATAEGERIERSAWGSRAPSSHSIQHAWGMGQLEGLLEGVSSADGMSEGSLDGIVREGDSGGGSRGTGGSGGSGRGSGGCDGGNGNIADGVREGRADSVMSEGGAGDVNDIIRGGSNGAGNEGGVREGSVDGAVPGGSSGEGSVGGAREGGAHGSMMEGSNGEESKSSCSLYSIQNMRGGGGGRVGGAREGGAHGSTMEGSIGEDSGSCCSLYSIQNVRGGGGRRVGSGREAGAHDSLMEGSNGEESKSSYSLYSVQNVRGGGPFRGGPPGAGGTGLHQVYCNGKIDDGGSNSSSSSIGYFEDRPAPMEHCNEDAQASAVVIVPCMLGAHQGTGSDVGASIVGSGSSNSLSGSRRRSSEKGSTRTSTSSSRSRPVCSGPESGVLLSRGGTGGGRSKSSERGGSSSSSSSSSSRRSSRQPVCCGPEAGLFLSRGDTGGGSTEGHSQSLPSTPHAPGQPSGGTIQEDGCPYQGEASVGREGSDLQSLAAPCAAEHGHCNRKESVEVAPASQERSRSSGSSSSVCSGRCYGLCSCSSRSGGLQQGECLRASMPQIGGPVNMPGWEQQEDGVVRFVGLTPCTSSEPVQPQRPDVSVDRNRPDLESLSARLQSMNEALSELSALHLRRQQA
ncbi:hypothetical protein DUNSADRAFT_4233 [Dunaliella salina]|uniref:Uncharacterized protein n=1 Tax=Dunaliella salina TaxID=3046 RepID=A0ABQ7GSF5_DUNSA|nr:hypothetical protein DUNSADRAFT_4233 [Dunaliella salina]|eukprot:KAF5837541.1 hypothetical protein DUNSADRAFT_4233 [Dunaliella salina]